MNEFHDYLKSELSKLNTVNGPLKMQVVDDIGRKTEFINLPHSTLELLEALAPSPVDIEALRDAEVILADKYERGNKFVYCKRQYFTDDENGGYIEIKNKAYIEDIEKDL